MRSGRQRTPEVAIRWRFLTLGVVLAVTMLAAFFAREIRFDGSVEVWFLDGDPQIELYHDFRDRFGKEQFIVVGLFPGQVFTVEFLEKLQRFTEEVADLPLATGVLSLTNAESLGYEDGNLVSVPLMRASSGEWPQTPEELDKARIRALESPFVAGSLLAEDSSATSIVVMLAPEAVDVDREIELVHQVRALAEKEFQGTTDYALAGTPAINDAVFRAARRDFLRTTPVAALVVGVLGFLLFRNWIATLVPLVIVGVTTVWVLGLMALLGWQMTFLTSALVLVIMVVGVADSVHILSSWQGERRRGRSSRDALRRSLYKLLPPCFFTTVTTMAGFLAMASCDMLPVRQFGILATVGALIAFLLSVFLTPFVLLLFSSSAPAALPDHGETRTDQFLRWLGRPTEKSSRRVLAVSAVLLLIAVAMVPSLRVSANPLTFFRPQEPIRRDMERVDEVFGGSATLEAVIRSPDMGLIEWQNVTRLDEFQEWLETLPAVSQTVCLVDVIQELDRVRPFRRNREGAPQGIYLALRRVARNDPELLGRLVQDDYSLGRMSIRVRLSDADALAAQAALMETYVQEHFSSPDLSIQYTGHVKLYNDMREYLVTAQVRSLALAAAVITLLMCALLRSWKLGLFSMIPNVIPIFCGLALMAVLDIPLDPGTVMIASVALGLVVDDTCHFLVNVRYRLAAGETLEQGIENAMDVAGRAIIVTSLILASGFSVLMLGSFAPSFYFGVITAAVIVIALAADLIVLPAALLVIRKTLQGK